MVVPWPAHHGARARRLVLAVAAALGVALLLHFDLWHCPVAELSRVPCPGCGLTRAALALLTGDWATAVALHPLSPVLVPWLALLGAGALHRFVRGASGACHPSAPAPAGALARAFERMTPLLLVLVVGVWVSRFFGAFGGPVQVSSHLLG